DMHAASLIREIKLIAPGITYSGIGGPGMQKENVRLLYDIKEVNFMGFSSVMRNIKKIKSVLNHCISEIKITNPEAVILVDYPGFNLRIAEKIRKFYKGKIIYYISPQLWAWHKSRVRIIKKFIDLMLVVFPFEVEFYKKEGVEALYTGHPLVKTMDTFLFGTKKIKEDKIQISILPGSRKDEIERMLPVLIRAADKFQEKFSCDINIICSTNYEEHYYEKFLKGKDFNLIYDRNNSNLNYKTILNSDMVITKSGTSTIECALIGTPFCVVYKAGKVNYLIGKNLVKVEHIAMVNILLNKKAVREFLQDEMTPENIFDEGSRILSDKEYREEMKTNFRSMREILTDKNASENAAKLIIDYLKFLK
ncbi:MAG: lipid-A-disaccharide synthase, partial [bacterium]